MSKRVQLQKHFNAISGLISECIHNLFLNLSVIITVDYKNNCQKYFFDNAI